jgi:heme exporter protein A
MITESFTDGDETIPILEIKDLQCIRDDRILFHHLNFTLNSRQILQIEGPNGSGKTSLLRMLCGLALPNEGTIYWQNKDIQEVKSDYWANLAYIGHTSGLKADLTPLENLAVSRALSLFPTSLTLEDALTQVGLSGFEEIPTRLLSAGQQRRVALARLLINQAQLWILDEPFTALDKKAIQMTEELIITHAQQGGMIVLTSHHALQYAAAITLTLTETMS